MKTPGTPEERFWRNVNKSSKNKCWEWTGYKGGPMKYGRLKVSSKWKMAHRFSYELHVGPIPEGLLVCHKCDNPQCVNPAHFFLGTYRDNNVDAVKKGRANKGFLRGVLCSRSKLTEKQVLEIRSLYNSQEIIFSKIAKEFNVSHGTISAIVRRTSWKHI